MNKYYIIRADKRRADRDRRMGVRVHNKIKADNEKRIAMRIAEIRATIPKCKPSDEPCPQCEDHRAINADGELVCPYLYMLWCSWIAFEDGNMAKWLEKMEKAHDKLIRPNN